MSTVQPMYKRNTLPWKQIQQYVFKLQKLIYQASLQNDTVNVRRLQKLLVSSWYAKAIAVRKVTQDNRGKRTAGTDAYQFFSSQEVRLITEDWREDYNGRKPVNGIY